MAFRAPKFPRFLVRYIDECPAVADCLVPLCNFPRDKGEVQRVGTQLWLAAQTVTKYFSGGKT
jgi:hypothetical protein